MVEAHRRLQMQNNMRVQAGSSQPLLRGWSQELGWFQFYFDDDRWVWSPQVEQMHGYRPGTVVPVTELVLSHVHPDDYQRVVDTLGRLRRIRRPFSSRHRIIDVRNDTHDVVMVGAPFHGVGGVPIGIRGACLDVTSVADHAAPTTPPGCVQVATRLRAGAGKDHPTAQAQIRAATQC